MPPEFNFYCAFLPSTITITAEDWALLCECAEVNKISASTFISNLIATGAKQQREAMSS